MASAERMHKDDPRMPFLQVGLHNGRPLFEDATGGKWVLLSSHSKRRGAGVLIYPAKVKGLKPIRLFRVRSG